MASKAGALIPRACRHEKISAENLGRGEGLDSYQSQSPRFPRGTGLPGRSIKNEEAATFFHEFDTAVLSVIDLMADTPGVLR